MHGRTTNGSGAPARAPVVPACMSDRASQCAEGGPRKPQPLNHDPPPRFAPTHTRHPACRFAQSTSNPAANPTPQILPPSAMAPTPACAPPAAIAVAGAEVRGSDSKDGQGSDRAVGRGGRRHSHRCCRDTYAPILSSTSTQSPTRSAIMLQCAVSSRGDPCSAESPSRVLIGLERLRRRAEVGYAHRARGADARGGFLHGRPSAGGAASLSRTWVGCCPRRSARH